MYRTRDRSLIKLHELIALLVLLCMPNLLLAKSWAQAVEDVSALADRYERAVEVSGGSVVGYTGNQGLVAEYNMHMCAILGRRLGLVERIRHLEPPQPEFDEPPSTLAWNVRSLHHWVRAAKRFSNMTQNQRRMHWNLECAGKHGIPSSDNVRRNSELYFERHGAYLYIHGDIVSGFHAELTRALYENPDVEYIGIGSGGGAVIEAIKAGIFIRSLGLKTQLSGNCFSACPLVFAAGQERLIMRDYPAIGLHEISINGKAVPADHQVYRVVARYLDEMGVDGDMLVSFMQRYSPQEMGLLDPETSCFSGIVTWHQHGINEGHC